MVATSEYALIRDDLEELSASWKETGAHLSFDVTSNYGRCAVDGCHAMAFVGLRTSRGPRPICLRHYGMIEPRQT